MTRKRTGLCFADSQRRIGFAVQALRFLLGGRFSQVLATGTLVRPLRVKAECPGLVG